MLRPPCFLFSDVHLGVTPPEVERSLLGFLEHVREAAGSVIINGDLFDFWFEWRTVMPRVGFKVLASLARLTEAGIPVIWIAGNHDCWGGDLLTRDVGVTYHTGPWTGEIAGWRTRIDHGDGLRVVEDRRYRRLRSLLRHRWSIRAFRWIHPDLGSRIALGSSHASRSYRARDGGEGLRMVAHRQLATLPDTDLLIFGHSHVPLIDQGEHGVYANAGTWMDDTTYLTIREDAVRLHRWSADQPELELSFVGRAATSAR